MPGGAPQRIGMAGAEPYRGMRFLEWLGLHACVLQLPESSIEVDPRLGPERLHQSQPLVEPGHQTRRVDLERGKHSMPSARANADVDPTAAQLVQCAQVLGQVSRGRIDVDRKSTRLNSSHGYISYAVFCLKKKRHIR